MKKFLGKNGFALITVFFVSTLLFGIIGFTFVSVNRQQNLKNLNLNSKRSFTVADAGLEQMINEVQNYNFLSLSDYLKNNDYEISYVYKLKNFNPNDVDNCYINDNNKILIKSAMPESFNNFNYRYKYFSISEDMETTSEIKFNIGFLNSINEFANNLNQLVFNGDESELENCKSCINNILINIKSDVENAYNYWANYVIQNTNELIEDLSGLTGNVSSCPDPNDIKIDKIFMPYDIDYPNSDGLYEGLIVKTASEMITESDKRIIVISAISYVFNKPISYDYYESIKNSLTLICPKPRDAEHQNYYVNALNIDETNIKLKNLPSEYYLTPVKRGIRAEFLIPYIKNDFFNLNLIAGNIILHSSESPPPEDESSEPSEIPPQIPIIYPYYIIGTQEDLSLPTYQFIAEYIYGPVRTNGSIKFNGTSTDVMIARDNIEYKGKYIFTYNDGTTYTVDFSEWDQTLNTQVPISPHFNGKNQVYIRKTEVEIDTGISFDFCYIDLNNNNTYDSADRIVFGIAKGDENYLPLNDNPTNPNDSLIDQARNKIYQETVGTNRNISNPNGYVEIDFQKNVVKYRKNGKGGWESITIPSEGLTLYVDSEVYFKGGGFLDGKVTVYSTKDVHFEGGPLRYKDSIKTTNDGNYPSDPTDIDMLGIITPGKVIMKNNSSNSMILDANILCGSGIETDKNKPNKIKINGSLTFYDTYTGEYRLETLTFDYNLLATRPPDFPLVWNLNQAASTPILKSPKKGLKNVSLKPTLSWYPSFGELPITYNVQVFTNLNDEPLLNLNNITNTYVDVTLPYDNTWYYWKVQASNIYGTSYWSDIWYFKTLDIDDEATAETYTTQILNNFNIQGTVIDIYFSRRLWREMVNPP